MATYTLRISDGTTTIDLYGGPSFITRLGGLELPPPKARVSYLYPDMEDGAFLTSATCQSRTITARVKVRGTSLSDLRDQIRALHNLLRLAQERRITGYGAAVYLEYQFGDTAGQSVYFDILRGEFKTPSDWFDFVPETQYTIVDAEITLECLPYGRYTNQDIATATLQNSQSGYDVKESFLSSDADFGPCYGNNWYYQTFTASANYSIAGFSLSGWVTGGATAQNIVYSLYATAAGKPNGAPLASVTLAAWSGNFDAASRTSHVRQLFAAPVALTLGTVYALVVSCTGNAGNYLNLRGHSAGGYAGGNSGYSNDGGGTWTAEAGKDLEFATFAVTTANKNYQEISVTGSFGDAPARLYQKIAQAGTTGTANLWVGRRSGARYQDALWAEGETGTVTSLMTSGGALYGRRASGTSFSGGQALDAIAGPANGASTEAAGYASFTFATPPRGSFRVLARVRAHGANFAKMGFALGYIYGTSAYAPLAADYQYLAAADTLKTLDLGLAVIPPLSESEIATNAPYTVRVYLYKNNFALAEGDYYSVDYIFLLPVDEGCAIISSDSLATYALDGISREKAVYKLSGAAVSSLASYVGAPFDMGLENTRIYLLRDDAITATYSVDLKYQPRFLLC